jgi:tetratricopeptide (TPR) repeat protein/tRNA A-37 threonylcarbamoyl transferase component Bud32
MVGKGAMGEVYAAYDPELDRKIAIKLLRVGRDRDTASEGRIRLMREAQAIAKLSHPNVVTVYDVGAFQNDVFIAMQFVDGNTIGYWMHAEPRTWTEILRVFSEAGRGLAAAHEKDLVHRDFKPENVMISVDGSVRVMDFGLARGVFERENDDHTAPGQSELAVEARAVLNLDLESTRAVARSGDAGNPRLGTPSETLNIRITQTGAMLGTPAYMSPEQFRGLPIDARSDQFSFCVALYEALYGERPFAGRTFAELMESVLQAGVRPAPEHAKIPLWLRRVVLRGLERNPENRWPSMKALLAELEKSRMGAPRRRFAAGAAAKLAGIWEVPRRGRAAESATKAEIRRAFLATGKKYAEAAFDKVSAILERYAKSWSDMYTDACEATHVRGEQSVETLELRLACLEECLDGLRALSQVFRAANADVVENAVSAANALGSVERSADVELLRAVVRPPEDPGIRAAVDRLRTQLAGVRVLCHVGHLSEGIRLMGPLEDEVRSAGYGPLLAETLFELGNLHIERRDAAAAALALEEAVWTAELSRHDEVAAKAAVQLVYVVGDAQLRFDAGEIWARHADTILRRMGGQEYLWGWLFNNRGAMRERQGRLTDAVEDARRAVTAKEKVYGPESAEVGMSLGNVAINLEQLGDVDAAVQTMKRALAILEQCLGPEHPRTAILLSNYGEILSRLGHFEEAARMCARAIAIFEGETAPDGVMLSYPLTALGLAYLGAGKAAQALPILERAATIRDEKENKSTCLGEVHFALACALSEGGGDLGRARELALRAREEYTREPPNPVTKWSLAQIDFWLETNSESRAP